jgi:putative ABC transport system permease protein
MSRRSRYGTPGLLARHTASGIVGSVLVAVLVAVTVFAAALAPRALTRLGTEELQHTLGAMSPVLRDLRGLGNIGLVTGLAGAPVDDVLGPTDRAVDRIREFLPQPLRDLAGEPHWVARTESGDALLPDGAAEVSAVGKLAVALDVQEQVRFVAGAAPGAWAGSETDSEDDPPLEVALSAASASELGVGVGDSIAFAPFELTVAGVYEPIDPDAEYWLQASDLAAPSVDREPGVIPTVRTTMLVAPESVGGLTFAFGGGALSAWVPIDPSGIGYADAALIATQTREAFASDVELPDAGRLGFSSRFADAIDAAVGRVVTASALLALALSGLLGVLLAVFALGVSTIVERRRPALTLASARGAGTVQLRGAMVLEGLAIAVPSTILALVAASLILPERVGVEGWLLPLVVGASVPTLFALLSGPRSARADRRDLQLRDGNRTRLVLELVVIGLAALSLYLLARRGLVASSEAVGVDPLLALTPLLLAASVCILTLRIYPVPLRLVLATLRRGDGATGLVGAARAVRSPSLGFAASFALIIGVSIVVFSSVMGTTLRDSVITGARDQVGADLQVSATAIGPDVVGALGRLPGIEAAAALDAIPGGRIVDANGTTGITLVFADTAALHAVRPDIPAVVRRDGGRIPLLASSDLSGRLAADPTMARIAVSVVGTVPVDALPGVARSWVLIDSAFAEELGRTSTQPQRVLFRLADDADPALLVPQIDRLVTDAQSETTRGVVVVTSAAQVLDELRSSPVVGGIEQALPLAAIAALLLTLLAVALGTLAAAGSRSHLVGVLRVLGADARQQRGILVWEFAPVVITSVLVGTAVGVSLPYIVTAVVDLRPFVGGRFPPDPVIDPLVVALAAVAVVGVAFVAGAIALALGRRIAPAASLKMGER